MIYVFTYLLHLAHKLVWLIKVGNPSALNWPAAPDKIRNFFSSRDAVPDKHPHYKTRSTTKYQSKLDHLSATI